MRGCVDSPLHARFCGPVWSDRSAWRLNFDCDVSVHGEHRRNSGRLGPAAPDSGSRGHDPCDLIRSRDCLPMFVCEDDGTQEAARGREHGTSSHAARVGLGCDRSIPSAIERSRAGAGSFCWSFTGSWSLHLGNSVATVSASAALPDVGDPFLGAGLRPRPRGRRPQRLVGYRRRGSWDMNNAEGNSFSKAVFGLVEGADATSRAGSSRTMRRSSCFAQHSSALSSI